MVLPRKNRWLFGIEKPAVFPDLKHRSLGGRTGMKKRTGIIIIILLCTLGAAGQDFLTKGVMEKGVVLCTVGENESLLVINTNYETGAYWFLIRGGYLNRLLGTNLSALCEVDQVMASAGARYLAVVSVGEGHPILEVVDLVLLRRQNKYEVLHKINPYPGTISINRWEKGKLLLFSDRHLRKIKKDRAGDYPAAGEKDTKFSLDPVTGKIVKIR
jgi:hypothetical protein